MEKPLGRFARATLEVSLKPWKRIEPESIRATCKHLFESWRTLIERCVRRIGRQQPPARFHLRRAGCVGRPPVPEENRRCRQKGRQGDFVRISRPRHVQNQVEPHPGKRTVISKKLLYAGVSVFDVPLEVPGLVPTARDLPASGPSLTPIESPTGNSACCSHQSPFNSFMNLTYCGNATSGSSRYGCHFFSHSSV